MRPHCVDAFIVNIVKLALGALHGMLDTLGGPPAPPVNQHQEDISSLGYYPAETFMRLEGVEGQV